MHMDTRKILVAKVKEANEILASLREEGYGDLNIVDASLANFQKIVGGKSNIFKIPSQLSKEKKALAIHSIDKFLYSKWATKEGREEIYNKRLATFRLSKKEGGRYGLTKKDTLKLFDVFASDVYHKLRQKFDLDSEQIIDIIRHAKKASSREIIDAMRNAGKSKNFDSQARYEIEKRLNKK